MAEEYSENNVNNTPQPNAFVSEQPQATPTWQATPAPQPVTEAASQPFLRRSIEPAVQSEPVVPSKGMFKCWTEALTRMMDLSGRTTKYEFWAFQSVSLVIFLLLALIGYFLAEPKMVLDIFAVYFLFPAASSCVRRLHDISMSGWWVAPAVVLALITLICWNLGVHNMVLLLFFTLVYVSVLYGYLRQEGDETDNAYGPKTAESKYSNIESRAFISFMNAFMVGLWIIFAAYLFKF